MFLPWIEAEFAMSESAANRMMRVASAYGSKSINVTDLTASALYELAAPSTPQPIRDEVEALLVDGQKVTPAEDDLHAELTMIDENLCRNELSPAERASQTARRKVIYLELHPETTHGGDRSKSQTLQLENEAERFTASTSAATGQSERLVQLNAERGEKVIPEVIDMITGTKLDTGTNLDKLKKLPPCTVSRPTLS